MSKQEVIICQNFNTELSQKLSAHSYDKIFILTDEHTFRLCLPLLQDIALLKDAEQIVIGPEDVHKTWRHCPMYGTSSATGEPPATRCS